MEKIYFNSLRYLSLFCVLSLFFVSIPDDYLLIVILPLLFLAFISTVFVRQMFKKFLTAKIFISLCFIKYSILPILNLYLKEFDSLNGNSYKFLQQAYLLMGYELLLIGILFYFLNKRNKNYQFQNKIEFFDKKNYFLKLCILIGFVGFIYYPEFIEGIIWLKEDVSSYEGNYVAIVGWFMGLMFYFVKYVPTFIFLLFLNYVRVKYPKLKPPSHLVYLCIIFALLNVIITYSENRGSIVANGIVSLSLLYYVFPHFRLRLLSLFSIVMFAAVINSTIIRMLDTSRLDDSAIQSMYQLYFVDETNTNLDAYLSGPSGVATGIKTYKIFKNQISTKTLLNDLIVNTNVLNQISYRVIDTNLKNDRTSVYFNKIVIGSRIPPMNIYGYIYLGILFSPFFSLLTIILMIYFEKLAHKSVGVFVFYAWLYVAVRFAFNPGLSISVLSGLFATYFLPFFILVYINNKLNFLNFTWR